ncbi:MAG: hypothetical protein D6765_04885 [Bacteroidetes bacterium]|nr:MAG: hypothetical protein D6765_04885 [Bacteroidota bacterium]
MKLLLFLCWVNTFPFSVPDSLPGKFLVVFTDKAHNEYALERPAEFLSERALQRRARQGLALDSLDLPVSRSYVDSLRALGLRVHSTSRWLNGAAVLADSATIEQVGELAFVDTVLRLGRFFEPAVREVKKNRSPQRREDFLGTENPYGYAHEQIAMLNGDSLHALGFRGQGVLIAVLDGGFTRLDEMAVFDPGFFENQLLFTRDVVDGDDYVFESASHGAQVLSTMAAHFPGVMVGTAPEASYACLKTEEVRGEYLFEEFNWVVGLELADSLGADVINSSLGYNLFDDTTMNYTHAALDGRTAPASRGAAIAARKGLLVVSSAGNDGASPWRRIDIPADAEGILSVGAVRLNGKRAPFSSLGPTADGRIKPEVVAPGVRVVTGSPFAPRLSRASGTSVAAPLVAGLAACLWQAFPTKTNQEILQAILRSCDQYEHPDNERGYGLPDFMKAYRLLKGKD